ncbi:transcription regulator HTH, apses-type DNA-binding domain-containing protein, partial [Mycena epipterygia]
PAHAHGHPPRFRPFASALHHVTKGRYITSNDPRGYIPVYEYPLNSQWIMMDIDDGYVLWTGIWKGAFSSPSDIVKMIDSQPELAHVIRRVRGGYLKIQGTWMPFEVALRLARRVAWNIREDLVPCSGKRLSLYFYFHFSGFFLGGVTPLCGGVSRVAGVLLRCFGGVVDGV